ncbi:MAG: CoA transferase [Chloroflexota bacterium]
MPLPLSGIKVVDMCVLLAGPYASMMLADQGAEVIKIEAPRGDNARNIGRRGDTDLSLTYLAFNRNKRSVALDITTPEGLEAAHKLCEWADVVIINMRVDTRRRRGFTYEQLSAINPKLIYVSLTGYGDDGPEANLPGADITLQARIGDIAERTMPGQPPPPHTQNYHIDMGTSMLTAYAVAIALLQRQQTGQGQKIETSLLQTGVALHAVQLTRVVNDPDFFGGPVTGFPSSYECSDGRWILSQFINLGLRWDEMCEALGLDDLHNDPRFATLPERQEHWQEIASVLSKTFKTKPAAEWDRLLKSREHMMSMVKTIDEMFDDVQIKANDMMTEFEQPGAGGAGRVISPARTFRMASTANEPFIRRHAPHLGEHTDEVLREIGYTDAAIANMRAKGAVTG